MYYSYFDEYRTHWWKAQGRQKKLVSDINDKHNNWEFFYDSIL